MQETHYRIIANEMSSVSKMHAWDTSSNFDDQLLNIILNITYMYFKEIFFGHLKPHGGQRALGNKRVPDRISVRGAHLAHFSEMCNFCSSDFNAAGQSHVMRKTQIIREVNVFLNWQAFLCPRLSY